MKECASFQRLLIDIEHLDLSMSNIYIAMPFTIILLPIPPSLLTEVNLSVYMRVNSTGSLLLASICVEQPQVRGVGFA